MMRALDGLLAIQMRRPHSDAFHKCGSSGTKTGLEEFLQCLGEIPWLIEGGRANYVSLNQDKEG